MTHMIVPEPEAGSFSDIMMGSGCRFPSLSSYGSLDMPKESRQGF